jgi:hypothetical protein
VRADQLRLAAAKAAERIRTLADARANNPQRFSTHQPPKILTLPETAWIKPPPESQTSGSSGGLTVEVHAAVTW